MYLFLEHLYLLILSIYEMIVIWFDLRVNQVLDYLYDTLMSFW